MRELRTVAPEPSTKSSISMFSSPKKSLATATRLGRFSS
jgi:hypothetical protein